MLAPVKKGANSRASSNGQRQDAPSVGTRSLRLRKPENYSVSWPLLAGVTNYNVKTVLISLEIRHVLKRWLQLYRISHRKPPVP